MNSKGKLLFFITLTLIAAGMLFSCNNSFFESELPAVEDVFAEDTDPTSGAYGRVKLSLVEAAAPQADRGARTVFPQKSLEFAYFFSENGGAFAARDDIEVIDDTVNLKIGVEWKIRVEAYLGSIDPAHRYATGESWSFRVRVDGETTEVNIDLIEELDNNDISTALSGTGSFEYVISFPFAVTLEISLEGLSVGSVVTQDITLNPVSNYEGQLNTYGEKLNDVPAGFYRLVAKATTSAGTATGFVEVVHIYRGLPTELRM